MRGILAAEIIDTYPQSFFNTNCKFDFKAGGKHRVLAWNFVGVVALREEFQYTAVDVEFNNKNLHRNLSLNDDFNFSMASMSYSGVLLANAAKQQN